MTNFKFVFYVFAITFVGCGMLPAQATRTWVSGVGDDANPCSRTAPCKTFTGAFFKTTPGGEIDVLDPGGFGAIIINHSITIEGGSSLASVLATSGSNGIVVAAGANDVVTLRHLTIQGAGSGLNGIRFTSGKALHIQHCEIAQFTSHGVDMEPSTAGAQLEMTDSVSQDNGGNGFYAVGPGNYVFATIDNSRFANNNNGIVASDYSKLAIRNSTASGNAQAGILAWRTRGKR